LVTVQKPNSLSNSLDGDFNVFNFHQGVYSDRLQAGWPGFASQQSSIPFKLCVCSQTVVITLLHTSLSPTNTFTGSEYGHFELIEIKLKK
jgi:hypothetical protein